MIGLGGIWTEVLGDVAVVPLPAGPERVSLAIRSLRGSTILDGGRGREPVDVDAAATLASRVGALLLESRLELVELNPVAVNGRGCVALDALARVRK